MNFPQGNNFEQIAVYTLTALLGYFKVITQL